MSDREHWNRASVDYQRVFTGGMSEYNSSVMALLESLGVTRPGSRVLDVGCGVGKYGTCFAALGCDVTLTDISEAMLGFARENMSAYESPWRCIECDFSAAEPGAAPLDRRYDLAISTFSPAVQGRAGLEKLSGAARWCFLSYFVAWRQPARDEFYRRMGLERSADMGERGAAEAQRTLEALCALGYRAHVRTLDYSWADERSPVQEAEYLLCRREPSAEPSAELMERGTGVAGELCDERGVFTDAVSTRVMWIYWNTEEVQMDIHEQFEQAGRRHGHLCPGLAIGVRAAREAAGRLGGDISCRVGKRACWNDGLCSVLALEPGEIGVGGSAEPPEFIFDGGELRLRLKPLPELEKAEKIEYILTAPAVFDVM